MQAAAAFNRAAFTARPLHRPPRPPLLHIAGAEDGPAGRRGAPLTRLRCSGSLSVGAGGYGNERVPVFPRQQSWDPYKLLGVDHDASEEEVRSARNFLLKQYAGYEESEEAIEGAYDKIIMNSYSHRKHSKINLKSKIKKQVEESPSWVKALLGYFEVPSLEIISRRLAFFGFIAGWSIATSAESGPAFQLALSLVSCIYFLNDKMKNLVRASTTGLGIFVGGWILGSLLVPAIPAFIIPPTWSIELLTSLLAYVFMFLGCTYLK
ncbi:protein CHAPERONE-LIKE PROTEIN OF POR1, chloroplastic-like [Panicum miliaceum]|uniref:Protein CHAPERONE-LIKE PROTEIN OF POR1, chloroplastic-like n=1 Tax=Panicum miliaceum TaxID=4540 RepID=A0A3L6RJG1_PANMI|nr:protein CHAPERONE-LIKE PROTEIN OF POR1, chloroplastic-like [Panicum miliaceum]